MQCMYLWLKVKPHWYKVCFFKQEAHSTFWSWLYSLPRSLARPVNTSASGCVFLQSVFLQSVLLQSTFTLSLVANSACEHQFKYISLVFQLACVLGEAAERQQKRGGRATELSADTPTACSRRLFPTWASFIIHIRSSRLHTGPQSAFSEHVTWVCVGWCIWYSSGHTVSNV